jgi:hypothetical protein
MSLIEAAANVVTGYLLALAIQIAAFPLFGLDVTLTDNLLLGLIFTSEDSSCDDFSSTSGRSRVAIEPLCGKYFPLARTAA